MDYTWWSCFGRCSPPPLGRRSPPQTVQRPYFFLLFWSWSYFSYFIFKIPTFSRQAWVFYSLLLLLFFDHHPYCVITKGNLSKRGFLVSLTLLKGTERIPESYLPSLATSCKNMASNSERIMEKSKNFQVVYAGCTNLCKHCTTDHARGIMKLGIFQRPHSTNAALSLPLEVIMISSAWRVQPLLGSCGFT